MTFWRREGGNAGTGGIVTLYVGNLPEKLHWSGLRQTFGRHGDIVDSYIAKKVNREGKRFGFVRYSNRIDANRAIERLDGFKLYGYRLSVSFAKFKTRTRFWRKKKIGGDRKGGQKHWTEIGKFQATGMERDDQMEKRVHVDPGNMDKMDELVTEKKRRRINGHVDNEILWQLGKCLVGTMATVVSAETVRDRLHGWGLGETKVKSLGGQKFLLQFEDEELVKLLAENNWSLLEEVFSKVEYWSESMKNDNRITWVEIRGIPLHCWNYETFTRIIEGWGKIIALGENGNMFHDGERVTLLVSTEQIRRIEEEVTIEVGFDEFNIWVSEIPVFFQTQHSSKKNNKEKVEGRKEGSASVPS
ncbi:hypothetical protein GQ457_15G029640 [Hibiscus cannabinus]